MLQTIRKWAMSAAWPKRISSAGLASARSAPPSIATGAFTAASLMASAVKKLKKWKASEQPHAEIVEPFSCELVEDFRRESY